jgi:hypothetical protein
VDAKNLYGEDYNLFSADSCSIPESQTHPEVVRRQFVYFFHKTQDFGQIKDPLDKNF